jgi:SRSO17 transposase
MELTKLALRDRGVVSASAYGVLDTVTFPLRFQIFKSERCLKSDGTYLTKPTIAGQLVAHRRRLQG